MSIRLPRPLGRSSALSTSCVLAALACMLSVPEVASADFSIRALDPIAGDTGSLGYGISGDGSLVSGWSSRSGTNREMAWTNGGGSYIGGSIGSTSYAMGVSRNGSAVVGYGQTGSNVTGRAYRWTAAGGTQNLGTFTGGSASAA